MNFNELCQFAYDSINFLTQVSRSRPSAKDKFMDLKQSGKSCLAIGGWWKWRFFFLSSMSIVQPIQYNQFIGNMMVKQLMEWSALFFFFRTSPSRGHEAEWIQWQTFFMEKSSHQGDVILTSVAASICWTCWGSRPHISTATLWNFMDGTCMSINPIWRVIMIT